MVSRGAVKRRVPLRLHATGRTISTGRPASLDWLLLDLPIELITYIFGFLDNPKELRLLNSKVADALLHLPYLFTTIWLRDDTSYSTENDLVGYSARPMAKTAQKLHIVVKPRSVELMDTTHASYDFLDFLKHVTSLHLTPAVMPINLTGLGKHNTLALESSNRILSHSTQLASLSLDMNLVHGAFLGAVHGVRFSNLRELRLVRTQSFKKQLTAFILKHASTLRELTLDSVTLTFGSWEKVFEKLRRQVDLDVCTLLTSATTWESVTYEAYDAFEAVFGAGVESLADGRVWRKSAANA